MSNGCYRAYLTPPWWVTMGYPPRQDFEGRPPAAFQPPVIGQAPPDQPPPVIGQTPPDQPPPVIGQAPPDQPPPVVGQGLVIAGTVSILQTSGLAAAAGATVDAHRRADDTTLVTATTDAMGNFSLSVPTEGPFDGYLTLTMSGLIPARVYVWRPPTSSIQIGNVFVTSSAMLSLLFQPLGLTATATQATVIILVRDSALSAVQVDAVSVLQGGSSVGYLFDPSSLGTSDAGIWDINVPPGATEVSATSKGTSFGPAQINAQPGQMTLALLITDQPQPTPSGRQDITVGGQPHSLAFDGTNIWAINQDNVTTVTASDGFLVSTFLVSTSQPWAAVSAGTTYPLMWVASSNGSSGRLTALSPLGDAHQTLNVLQQPIALAAVQYDDLPEPLLYFVDMNSDLLWRVDPTTSGVTAVGPIAPGRSGLGPQIMLFDGTNIWISNAFNNSISKMDKYGVWQATFSVGNMPGGLAFDGNSIWVANSNDNTVAKLGADDGQIQKIITTGTDPNWMAFDGTNIWVTNWGSNTLTQIRASDGAVIGNFATGLNPNGVVFDGAHIWVANSGTNTISKY
jgi:YVTN family beta-propeller protein